MEFILGIIGLFCFIVWTLAQFATFEIKNHARRQTALLEEVRDILKRVG